MTADEMKAELYERARVYMAQAHPEYDSEAIASHARHGVDAMINARITAGEDEAKALEYAIGCDIKKLITVVVT